MKVYVVSRGWDDPDCSPQIDRIFARREDATSFVEESVQAEMHDQKICQDWPARIREAGPNRWSIEIELDHLGWCQDEVWLIEEHVVHTGE